MTITKPCVVTLTWTLHDAQNHTLDALDEPTEFLFGGDDLLPKVEEAIEGQEAGFETHLHLEPEYAFGEYEPQLVCFEDRRLFPEGVEPGMRFEGLPPGSATPDMPADAIYTVTEVYPSHVVLDGNHPLAGMALRLMLSVRDVREASEGEVAAGSVGSELVSLVDIAPHGMPLH
jgi:FKBP-type peptidyl-prolyl cis-trans isomerase SlyD